jgi:glycosyltransferase involved in cell wall biosynthesis
MGRPRGGSLTKFSREHEPGERIALFVPDLQGGGAERVMLALANNFCSAGFKVDLVLQRATGPYLREVNEDITIVDLKATRLISSLVPLIRYFRTARPSAMLSTPSDANVVAVTAWIAARAAGRLVVREATTPSVDDAAGRGWRAKVVPFIRRRAYRHASHVVAPSLGVAEDLIRNVGVPRSRITVIANPLDTERIQSLAAATAGQIVLPPHAKVILGVGQLTAIKDFATLIRAFSKICQARDAILLVLGEGDERESLCQLASELGVLDKVFLPGFVENPFVYMKRAAVFVHSSRYEGLPNALLQALMVGTPVVATDCRSGPREILEEGRWGRLVPVGDVTAMAQGIIDGLDGQLAKPPMSLMKERYGVESIAKQYLGVLLSTAVAANPL